ncbi:MAG: chemotaxis protein CheW [Myxococcota bacterium]
MDDAHLDDEILEEFLVESTEALEQAERDLVGLEQAPGDPDLLARIFRSVHTIKGTCGFLGFGRLEALTHAGENLLSRLRDGELALDQARADALLAMVDVVRSLLRTIEATRSDGDDDHAALVARLMALREPDANVSPEPERDARPERVAPAAESDAGVRCASDASIRVDVGLLDELMNLVGELVLARNQILQLAQDDDRGLFAGTTQRLNHITTELQERVMKTRMQPVGKVWNKLPRLVREVANACDKRVRLEMEGRETELDKTLIEAITNPLTHIVRNAIDHGIESAGVRQERGKTPEGTLLLRAFHEGGHVYIEVADDGAGIDLERVRDKAVERGLVPRDQAARMSDREVLSCIFLPGFSTVSEVTSVSGRGVGMDVVRTDIERIGGTVDLDSRPGRGTTFRVKIPLTLAIIPALIVRSGGARYALPQASLLELVRLEGEQARRGIETIHGVPVHRLRGRLLPLVHLADELGTDPAPEEDGSVHIVVLSAGERSFGLVVDGIQDTEEIVVKPLGRQLGGVDVYAGATIMGDGRVALILDAPSIARRAGLLDAGTDSTLASAPAEPEETSGERSSMLLVGLGEERRLAVPLEAVARLEEIRADAVERAGRHRVIQYRGEIMPLVDVAVALEEPSPEPSGVRQVVVVSGADGASVGLLVERIEDVVDAALDLHRLPGGGPVGGYAVVEGRVTELLDVEALVRLSHNPLIAVERGAAAEVR